MSLVRYFDIKDPFPWDDCTSLVIYAGKSFDDDPDKSFPSLVFHNHDVKKSELLADKAPYLSVLDAKDMLKEITIWKDKSVDSRDSRHALKAEKWVKEKISKGWTHFLYELEPKDYAGGAYLWAKYTESK